MPGRLSELLKQLRLRSRLSQAHLAAELHLKPSTVYRWESDKAAPRAEQLEAALVRLGASDAEVRWARMLLARPRAAATMPPPMSMPDPFDPDCYLVNGSLLRAMRVRNQLTREQVAASMGVDVSTIGRWETSRAYPEVYRLPRLLQTYNATSEERNILTAMHEGGRVRSVFRALSIDDCSAKLGALAPLVDADLHISGDLEFLTILTALLAHTTSQPAATELYAEATYLYSEWLLRRGRLNEAGKSAHRSLEVRDQCGGPTRSSLNGLYIAAKYEVEGNGRLSPDRGIRFIEKWLPLAEEFGEATHRYRDMAGFAIQARRFDEALRLLDRAIEVAPQAICPRALFMAQSVRADALLMSGNAPGAVRILPEPRTDLAPTLVVFDAFLRARILLAANGKAEASYWTQAARDTIDQFGLANLEGDYARITRVMT